MKLKNYLLICIIFAILISSISTINAISNDNINNLSEWNSNNDHISIENNEQKCSINDNGNILDLKKNDINGEEDDNLDDNEYDELDDDVEEDWDENNESTDEDDDDDDELDTWNIADELDDEDINEYLECINSTTDTYLKFIKYLIKDKGFKFNNLFSEEDEGYHIFASQTYEGKLYDGNKFLISKGDSYYVSTNPRMAYVLDTYYPDVICSYDDKYSIDEMYLGWLKWEEKYQLSLNPSDKVDFINSTVFTSNSSILPPTFDLRNVNGNNYVTPIKDQGRAGNCWAFASIAALESYLLKSEGISYNFSNTIDLSENNLKNVMSSRGEMGMETPTNEGGNSNMAIAYFTRWSGPILESQDEYLSDIVIEDYKAFKHVQGIKYISPRNDSKDNNEIKQAIMNYGGVVTSLLWNEKFCNECNYYCYNANLADEKDGHEICIIGWDDNYPAKNFNNLPKGDGAFIVKNSWGEDAGKNGYFYVSYYDTTLAYRQENEIGGGVGFAFTSVENNTNYGRNYHYNPLGVTFWFNNHTSKAIKYRNKWVADYNETLKACGIYVNGSVECLIKILVDDNEVSEKYCILDFPGFHTIIFDTPIKINGGQTFKIEVALKSNDKIIPIPLEAPVYYKNIKKTYFLKATSNIGESELYTTEGWVDVSKLFKNANLCLNAYTEYDNRLPTKIEAFDLTMTYGENNILTATLTDLNNTRLKNMNLTFCIDNNTYVITTNEDGQATMQINNLPNTYKVVIHYFGNEKYSDTRKTITLTINPIIKDNVDIFFDIKDIKSQIKFSLKSEGKPLKYGIVNIKIGKKWYKGKKLDKNGNYILKKHLNDPTKFTVNFLGNNYFKPTSKSIYIYENLDITGLKSCEDTGKLHLILTKTINLKVCLKISSKKFKLKFKNGKVTFKPSKYKLKKGKKYKLVFSFKNNKYHLNKSYKLKIK